ncbi:hypothetical protein GGX14DRAFT_443073 [Mycena pura]|uniref:Uncharacterized protein n=1 Tax=Mycena pura TaxID=153505 RepID=A0AAD6VLB2_9AGAR|nr:hypothetical protein GGX14DRAFT_443073 [Mycena pura]
MDMTPLPRPPKAAARPVLGHVNLMADTLIANATLDDLRAIVRSMVASATPGIAAALTAAARERLAHHPPCAPADAYPPSPPPSGGSSPSHSYAAISGALPLFTPYGPTPHLHDTLRRARALYGSGMGFASLGLLATVVRCAHGHGLRWAAEDEGELADCLAVIDADIAQAIQSCKEEIESGRAGPGSHEHAHAALADLRAALDAAAREWGPGAAEFPFERAAASLGCWKIAL